MTDCMVDIETLSVRPNAIILTIGAIKFHRKGKMQPLKKLKTFYRKITLDSCKNLGMHKSDETQAWWDIQDKKARYEVFDCPDRVPLKQALQELTEFFQGCNYIWSHGSNFDTVILGEAYHLCELLVPWKFWNIRDTRTLFDLGGVTMRDLPENDKHNAIADCYRQIIGVKMSLDNILRK